MNDMAQTIIPKSDQMNADDLIAGPRTIKITDVRINPGTEQPVAVNFQGDNGKPYLPCKSMRRVMVHVWGPDGSAYVGRSMTLYRDEKVMFGGAAVGALGVFLYKKFTHPAGQVFTSAVMAPTMSAIATPPALCPP